jgi:putative DNA primase/helicase
MNNLTTKNTKPQAKTPNIPAREGNISRKIDADAILAEFETLSKPSGNVKVLAHSEILNAILETLDAINFKAVAGLDDEEKLPQKHLLVLCVNELLSKVKEQNLDLARKDDFIFAFNGAFWKELNRETIKNFLGNVAERLSVHSLEAQHYKFKNELYNQFLSSAHFEPIEPQNGKVLINLLNGTFEISKDSQTLREFNAEDFLTYQLPFEFDETATCPVFQKYLNKVLPEQELQNVIAEFFGYVFTKNLKMEKALLLYGSGANGKSVLFDIMNALLGSENIANFSMSNLLEEHNRALIAYKLLNYGSEINATRTRDEFKNLVSTEPIQARLKYGNSFTMRNYAKLAFNCNELPKDFDHQNAYFRRLLIIPFRVTLPESEWDQTLAQKIIKSELAGVFNWIIEGLKRLLKTEKFTASQIVKDTLDIYKRESDSVASFVDEHSLIVGLSLKTVYSDYRSYCIECGMQPLGRSNFSKRLQAQGFIVEKQNYGFGVTGVRP